MAKKLYIIDGHSHIYAAYFAPMRQQLTSPTGEPTKAVYIFTTALLGILQRDRPDMLVVTMDSKGPSFRADMYADYKAHRPPMPEDLQLQIMRIEEICAALKIPIVRLDSFEADDLIGTLAKKAAHKGIQSFICSKDKDMLQLIDENVCVYDISSGKVTDSATMMQDMGITPAQFIDVLALQGDAVDNVPGVPDVGPKTAIEWIKKYGSLENLYEHADEITGKRGHNLRNSRDLAFLSKQLVTIDCNVPIEINEDVFAVAEPDNIALAELFSGLGFSRLMTQLGLSSDETSVPVEQPQGPGSIKNVVHKYELVDTPEKFAIFLKELSSQQIFAINTETNSLEAMRADLVGLSFSWQAHTGWYLPIKARLGDPYLDINLIRDKLAPILADPQIRKVGQKLKFDMLVLRNAGMPLKGIYFDTLVATYCLDPLRPNVSLDELANEILNYSCISMTSLIGTGRNKLTFDMVDTEAACEYAAEEVDITWQLYQRLKGRLENQPQIQRLFEQVEMPLILVLAQMEFNGVSIDAAILRRMSGDIAAEMNKVAEEIYKQAGMVFNIDSPKQLGAVLFDHLGLASAEIGKTGRSTSASVLEDLAQEHPIAEKVLLYRQLSKLQNTYVEKLGTLINPRTNRVHASFNQTITATGRLSSSEPNLQNIPIRTELGRKIRSAFVPRNNEDYILSADYSQVELRLLAHFSKDRELMRAFAEDRDIHSFVASQIYDMPLEDVTREQRSNCKAVNFGLIYGQGAFGLSRTIGISVAEAREFIEKYFARYNSIKSFMDEVIERTAKIGYAETILGRRRPIRDLKSSNGNKRNQAQRMAFNTVLQGSAADLIKVAMINIQRRIEKEKLPAEMILQIHDELVFEIPASQAEYHSKWISQEMSNALELSVPIKVDVTYGPSWLK